MINWSKRSKAIRHPWVYLILFLGITFLISLLVWIYPSDIESNTAAIKMKIDEADHDVKLEWLKTLGRNEELFIHSRWGIINYTVKPINTNIKSEGEQFDKLRGLYFYPSYDFGIIQTDANTLIRIPSSDTIKGIEGYTIKRNILTEDTAQLYFYCHDQYQRRTLLEITGDDVKIKYAGNTVFDQTILSLDDKYIYADPNLAWWVNTKHYLLRYKLYESYGDWQNSDTGADTLFCEENGKEFIPIRTFSVYRQLYCLGEVKGDTNVNIYSYADDKGWSLYSGVATYGYITQTGYHYPYIYMLFGQHKVVERQDLFVNPSSNIMVLNDIQYPISSFSVQNDTMLSVVASNGVSHFSYMIGFPKLSGSHKLLTRNFLFRSDTMDQDASYFDFNSTGVRYYTYNENWKLHFQSYDGKVHREFEMPSYYYTFYVYLFSSGRPIVYGIVGNNIAVTQIYSDEQGLIKEKIIYHSWPEYPFTVEVSYNVMLIVTYSMLYILFMGIALMIARDKVKSETLSELSIVQDLPVLKRRLSGLEEQNAKLRRRSDSMLIAGIFIAVVGIVVFLSEFGNSERLYDKESDSGSILAFYLMFRPFVLMIFIESIALFFLRQHRIIFNEFKDFYAVYMRLHKYLQLLELYDNPILAANMKDRVAEQIFQLNASETNSFTQVETDNHTVDPEFQKLLRELRQSITLLQEKFK